MGASGLLAAAMVALLAPPIVLIAVIVYDIVRFRIGVYRIKLDPITGYAERYSYQRGEPIALFIHSTKPARLSVRRLDDEWRDVGSPIAVAAERQSNRFHRKFGLAWRESLSVDTAPLPAGMYRFDLTHEGEPATRFSIPILVKDEHPEKLSVILSTNTWDAYSVFGGASHYENTLIHRPTRVLLDFLSARLWMKGEQWRSNFVPIRRPKNLFSREVAIPFDQDYGSYVVRYEMELLRFLAKNGFNYGVYGDRDLAEDESLQKSTALIFPGHTEYWTDGMFYALERFLNGGGKLLATMGGLEKTIVYLPGCLKVRNEIPPELVRKWFGTFPTTVGLFTAAPFRVTRADAWPFAGTGVRDGTVFGEDTATVPSFDLPGHAHWANKIDLDALPRRGASGFLTGEVGAGSGAFAVLAAGMNSLGPAHMVYRDLPQGGWIFNASSGTFNGALFRDAVIERLMLNLLADAVGEGPARRLDGAGAGTAVEPASSRAAPPTGSAHSH